MTAGYRTCCRTPRGTKHAALCPYTEAMPCPICGTAPGDQHQRYAHERHDLATLGYPFAKPPPNPGWVTPRPRPRRTPPVSLPTAILVASWIVGLAVMAAARCPIH